MMIQITMRFVKLIHFIFGLKNPKEILQDTLKKIFEEILVYRLR